MEFPTRLKRLRNAAKMSQQELALRCDRSGQSWVGNFEAGDRKPDFDDIPKLARALGVHPGELFWDLPPPSQPVGFDPEKLALSHQILREAYAADRKEYSIESEPDALVELYERLIKAGSNPAAVAALGRITGDKKGSTSDERDTGDSGLGATKGRKRANSST